MTYLLYIDDERTPPPYDMALKVVIARTVDEAKCKTEADLPEALSLDHDLGGDETAMQYLNWLIEKHLNGEIDARRIGKIMIHSANPTGVKNLEGLWNSFATFIGSDVRADTKWGMRK